MKLSTAAEKKLKDRVIAILENGRPKWDVAHTLLAVGYMRKLIRAEGGDETTLISAMYLHDIGYIGLIKEGYKLNEVMDSKALHMEVGARQAKQLLKELEYPAKVIEKIVHLVKMHDKVAELTTKEELLVMEADTLAALNTRRIKPTFNREDYLKYLSDVEKIRVPRFVTKKGKNILVKLLREAKSYYS